MTGTDLIEKIDYGFLTEFDPSLFKEELAKADAIKDLAIKLKDRTILQQAAAFRAAKVAQAVLHYNGEVKGQGQRSDLELRQSADEVAKALGFSETTLRTWRAHLTTRDGTIDRERYATTLLTSWMMTAGMLEPAVAEDEEPEPVATPAQSKPGNLKSDAPAKDTKLSDNILEMIAAQAARVKDHTRILEAAMEKEAQIEVLVKMWDMYVGETANGWRSKAQKAHSQKPVLGVQEAEKIFGVSQWQITRWRKALDKGHYCYRLADAWMGNAGLSEHLRARRRAIRRKPDRSLIAQSRRLMDGATGQELAQMERELHQRRINTGGIAREQAAAD